MTRESRAALDLQIASGELKSPRHDDPHVRGIGGYGHGPIAQAVDVRDAQATVPADKEYIMAQVGLIGTDERERFWTECRSSSTNFANPSHGNTASRDL
jgi:hypothetical protein